MSGKISSNYRRKNGYKKRRWRYIIIIASLAIVVLFLVFLVVGNLLNKKTNDTDGVNTSKVSSTALAENLAAPYSIKGHYIDLNNLSSSLSELSKNSETNVSVKLSDDAGKLLYSSPTAQKFGYQSTSTSLMDLGTLIKNVKSYGISANAVITLNGFSEKDAKTRAVILAYEAALVCEISEYGVSDITVRCSEAATEHIDEILSFADTVKNINGDIKIGIAVKNELLEHPDGALYIDKLARAYTFIAFDLTASGEQEYLEFVDNSVSNPNNKYYILRYNMRVLLTYSNDPETEKSVQYTIEANSIQNWQKIS